MTSRIAHSTALSRLWLSITLRWRAAELGYRPGWLESRLHCLRRVFARGGEEVSLTVIKVAVASEDGRTVAADFRTARQYVVLTIEDGRIVSRESRPKVAGAPAQLASGPRDPNDHFAGHRVGPGPRSRHDEMAAAVGDCAAVLAGEISTGARNALNGYGIDPVTTPAQDIDDAVSRYIEGIDEAKP